MSALGVRFLLELGSLVALALWGAHAFPPPWRWVAAVLAPLAFATAWGFFASPKAPFRRGIAGQLVIELVLFGLVVAALLAAGRVGWAVGFAVVALIDRVALTVLQPHPPAPARTRIRAAKPG